MSPGVAVALRRGSITSAERTMLVRECEGEARRVAINLPVQGSDFAVSNEDRAVLEAALGVATAMPSRPGTPTGETDATAHEWRFALLRSHVARNHLRLAVALAMAQHWSSKQRVTYVGNGTVAGYLGVTRETVNRHVKELARGGWLACARHQGRAKAYRLDIPGEQL